MRRVRLLLSVITFLGLFGTTLQGRESRRVWNVNGVEREAVVIAPKNSDSHPTPLVFVFHGHGGSINGSMKSFGLQEAWPEAIVVYPQGIKTPGRLTDPTGQRTGWQHRPGDQEDRDLKFFDAMLATLKAEYAVDERRIYATGHSNGGGFTYLVWRMRPEVFAAIAPSGATPGRETEPPLKPIPVMHIAGENDPLVKFEWQQLGIRLLLKNNACVAEGKPQGEHLMIYESSGGTPVVTYITREGHKFPASSVPHIVKFFQTHRKSDLNKSESSGTRQATQNSANP